MAEFLGDDLLGLLFRLLPPLRPFLLPLLLLEALTGLLSSCLLLLAMVGTGRPLLRVGETEVETPDSRVESCSSLEK